MDKIVYKALGLYSSDKWVCYNWLLLEDILIQQHWIEFSRAVLTVGMRNNSFECWYWTAEDNCSCGKTLPHSNSQGALK